MDIKTIKKHIQKYNITLDNLDSKPFSNKNEIKQYLTAEKLITEYSNGNITFPVLYESLTFELFKHFKSTIDAAKEYRNSLSKTSRNMQVFYITGPSGSGKTTYAKYLANKYYKNNIYITGNSGNPFDGYDMQKCVILDEFRSSDFRFSELLELLDNHTTRAQAARYHDVNMCNCELMFVTSIYAPDVLYMNMMEREGNSEPKEQLYRRLGYKYWQIDNNGDIWEISLKDNTKKPLVFNNERQNSALAIESLKNNDNSLFVNDYKEEIKEIKAKVFKDTYDEDGELWK